MLIILQVHTYDVHIVYAKKMESLPLCRVYVNESLYENFAYVKLG